MGMPAGAIFLVFMTLQIVCIAGALLYPDEFRYLSPQNLTILMKAIPVLGCLALGAGVLMIAGEFDLSIGSVYTFTAVLMASLVNAGLSAFVAAPIGILTGLLIGSLNGHITLRFGLPSFIVTLGGLLFWRGAVLLYNGAVQVRFDPEPVFTSLFSGTLFGVNAAFIWIVLFVIGFHLLLHRHRFGNHVFATGGNRAAAEAIGINTSRVKLIAFAIAGGMAAVAGILATARVGAACSLGRVRVWNSRPSPPASSAACRCAEGADRSSESFSACCSSTRLPMSCFSCGHRASTSTCSSPR